MDGFILAPRVFIHVYSTSLDQVEHSQSNLQRPRIESGPSFGFAVQLVSRENRTYSPCLGRINNHPESCNINCTCHMSSFPPSPGSIVLRPSVRTARRLTSMGDGARLVKDHRPNLASNGDPRRPTLPPTPRCLRLPRSEDALHWSSRLVCGRKSRRQHRSPPAPGVCSSSHTP